MIIGLTGGIAVGKSTVSRTFLKYGIPVVDADLVAREVVKVGTAGWKMIVNCFGQDYLNEDQTINRVKLGNLAFQNPKVMKNLNKIMGPLIDNEAYWQFQDLEASGFKTIVWDAALIIENGNYDKYKPLIVVSCLEEIQCQRLMKRNVLTEEQAMGRIKCQMPSSEKVKYADYVINTNNTIDNSISQTVNIISKVVGCV